MEIRRAILLFAVVLGLAALVTSFTRPADEEGDRGAPDAETEDRRESSGDGPRTQPRPLPATARPASGPAERRFPAGARAVTRSLDSGRAATLTVEVLAPGQVAIEDLGLDAAAQPGTPARFDVLAADPGRYAIAFTPANGADGRTIGRLRVRE